MATVLSLPSTSNAFSQYRPSSNAHLDFLTPSNIGKKRDGSARDKGGPKVVKLSLPHSDPGPSVQSQVAVLCNAIAPILNGLPPTIPYQTVSSTCYRLVSPPNMMGAEIYQRIDQEMTKHLTSFVRNYMLDSGSKEGSWLVHLMAGWKQWEERVSLLSAVFVYLDRIYCDQHSDVLSLKDLGISTFKSTVWENDALLQKTISELLAWAARERATSLPETDLRPTIAAVIHLSSNTLKDSILRSPYMKALKQHYIDEAASNIVKVKSGEMSALAYIKWVMLVAHEEGERTDACLWPDRKERSMTIVKTEAGTSKIGDVLQTALSNSLDTEALEDFASIYRFCVECSVFKEISKSLAAYIENRLKTLISNPENDPKMIDGALTLKHLANDALQFIEKDDSDLEIQAEKAGDEEPAVKLLRQSRARRLELDDTIRMGFKAGLGSRQNAPAEWIAKHLDAVMRRGQGSGSEEQFNAQLDEIVALIGFTRDKDVFKAFYSSQLAKRLLLSKSASDDMERNMIIKLQREMGEEFTSGDVMMKDLSLSETLVRSYQSAQAKNPEEFKNAGDFTANVLTESAWPAYPLLKEGWAFKLTPELQSSIDQFTSWYSTLHKNRQLSWRWQLATVTISARFPSGKYEVGVSLFQAVVMLQFNDEDTLDFKELKARTGIETSELVRTLQSLALGRRGTRVLLKKPAGKEVGPDDVFAWNKGFNSERIKFRINQIQQDMSAEESKKTNEQVAIDRVSVLEATIVRIMKARKKMTLQHLIDAVVTDVSKRFPPDVKEIKKRMESLIEREFLRRDDEDRGMLHYVA